MPHTKRWGRTEWRTEVGCALNLTTILIHTCPEGEPMPFCHNCLRDIPSNECHSHCIQHPFASEASRLRWGLQWMLNNLTGIDHEWAREACAIARQSLAPKTETIYGQKISKAQ